MLRLAPGIEVPAPEPGTKLRYAPEAAERVIQFFKLLVFAQNRWAGKPFVLQPWQEEMIRAFYGVQVLDDEGNWVRYRRFLYNEIPKKNGKTELAAGLGLYHLLADGEAIPNVGIFAVDRENAETLYKAAKYMVEHTAMSQPPHRPMVYCRDSVREIRTRFGGLMKVYSNDVENKHGPSFSAILCDELHAWKGRGGRARWEVLTQGSDAARLQQTVLVLTTAGDDPDKIAALDIYDEALWKRCNPNYGVILQPRKFRAEAKAAKLSEGSERSFRWLRLNQWVATKDVGWIPLTIYDKTQIGPSAKGEREEWVREHLAGKRCYGGLDLSATTDLTAFVLLFPPQEGLDSWVMLPRAWRPLDGVVEAERRDHVPYRDWERAGFLHLCPGDLIDYSAVERAIYEGLQVLRHCIIEGTEICILLLDKLHVEQHEQLL